MTDSRVIEALTAIDNLTVQTALANSVAWFKKANMSEVEVRAKYKPLIYKPMGRDGVEEFDFVTKFKVKCPPISKWPTELHRQLPNGDILVDGASVEDLCGVGVQEEWK